MCKIVPSSTVASVFISSSVLDLLSTYFDVFFTLRSSTGVSFSRRINLVSSVGHCFGIA